MRFLFRVLSLFALAVAVVMAVVDATRTIAASAWTFTPLIESWRATWPEMLDSVRGAVERGALPALWDPVLVWVLTLPGWLIFAGLALGFYALGRRRRRRSEESFAVTP